jgi:hypothetical protein
MNDRISFIQGSIKAVEADIRSGSTAAISDGSAAVWRHREHAYLCSLLLLVAHPGIPEAVDGDLADLDALIAIAHAHPTHPATQLLRQYLLGLPGMKLDRDGQIQVFSDQHTRDQHGFVAARCGMMPFPNGRPAVAA